MKHFSAVGQTVSTNPAEQISKRHFRQVPWDFPGNWYSTELSLSLRQQVDIFGLDCKFKSNRSSHII